MARALLPILLLLSLPLSAQPSEPFPLWPDLAPGETTKLPGNPLPANPRDQAPISRIEKVTQPTIQAYLPEQGGNGAAVLVLPGGGFRVVVPNLEGSEVADFFNPRGVAVFVLNYRTSTGSPSEAWQRPLQDSRRAIRHLRANAKKWNLDPDKIGLLAFSAGGHVGAIHIGDQPDGYEAIDDIDKISARPDFALLVYPWKVADPSTDKLLTPIQIGKKAPPTFLVHTSDDQSSSLGALGIYTALKKAGVSAELHVYQNGGHGYGVRKRTGSVINTWIDRALEWMEVRAIIESI